MSRQRNNRVRKRAGLSYSLGELYDYRSLVKAEKSTPARENKSVAPPAENYTPVKYRKSYPPGAIVKRRGDHFVCILPSARGRRLRVFAPDQTELSYRAWSWWERPRPQSTVQKLASQISRTIEF